MFVQLVSFWGNHFQISQGCRHEIWSGTVAVGGNTAKDSGTEVCRADPSVRSAEKNFFHLHFSVIRMGSHHTTLWRLGSVTFKLSISSSVNRAVWLPTSLLGAPPNSWILAGMWLLPRKVVQLKPGQPYWWLRACIIRYQLVLPHNV